MLWFERVSIFALGAATTSTIFLFLGRLKIDGEFFGNIAGAAIGGMITVGLALLMFNKERQIAILDSRSTKQASRAEDIRQALRHVRSVRECLIGASGVTINTSERIFRALDKSIELSRRALTDLNLTDFPLRFAIEDAASIGATTSAKLKADLAAANLQEANQALPTAEGDCNLALESIDKLIDSYTQIRKAVPGEV